MTAIWMEAPARSECWQGAQNTLVLLKRKDTRGTGGEDREVTGGQIHPEKLSFQCLETTTDIQKMKTCHSLLLLLLGLCQAQPLVGKESMADVLEDHEDMDISTEILNLISNIDSSEILLEGDLLASSKNEKPLRM
ncbi:unnamed protein product [Arctogadus glacialis]